MKEASGWGNWAFGGWSVWLINMAMYLGIAIVCMFVFLAILNCVLGRMQMALEGIRVPRMLLVRQTKVCDEEEAGYIDRVQEGFERLGRLEATEYTARTEIRLEGT